MIYILMAVEFKSYLKPLGVLSAVPFGMMGAVFGHFIMGLNFSVLSFLGVLAASGVVVNDNLVLMDRINQLRAEGLVICDRDGRIMRYRLADPRVRPMLERMYEVFCPKPISGEDNAYDNHHQPDH